MKAPEKIKKGLECCSNATVESCGECPYHTKEDYSAVCIVHLTKDAKVLLAQVERERDALKLDFLNDPCLACKHGPAALDDCKSPYIPCKFEWRGVCPENTKEDER